MLPAWLLPTLRRLWPSQRLDCAAFMAAPSSFDLCSISFCVCTRQTVYGGWSLGACWLALHGGVFGSLEEPKGYGVPVCYLAVLPSSSWPVDGVMGLEGLFASLRLRIRLDASSMGPAHLGTVQYITPELFCLQCY